MKHLTHERLVNLLSYCPDTGLFTWRVRRNQHATVGEIAGTVSSHGYVVIQVDGIFHRAHRLAFLAMTGAFPERHVDHINGIRNDNRWSNLRIATRQQNNSNVKKRVDNQSGVKGVHWSKPDRKWVAGIRVNGTRYHLGYFSAKADAAQCYNGAAALAFGEFMRKQATP